VVSLPATPAIRGLKSFLRGGTLFTMKTRQEIINILRDKKVDLAQNYGVRKMALFGSYARNEQKEGSDIDVVVEFEKPISGLRFVSLAEAIESAIGMRADVVPADGIKPRYFDFIGKDLVYV
jgi:predicted nucleotidyltransferase